MASLLAANAQPSFPDLLRGWRKIRKLSQSSLALEAEVSQRHLSFLESGRSSPSREMVLSLATTLGLPLREQNVLLNAAGFASVHPETQINQDELKHARHALSVMLEYQDPYPAIVIDRNWNILMMNDATARLFSLFVDPVTMWSDISPDKSPNVMRATLHEKGMRPYITNWEVFAAYFNYQLTQELAANPYNREARELLDEIRSYPNMPAPSAPSSSGSRDAKPFLPLELKKGDLNLDFFSIVATFGTPTDVTLQELRIETFFPGNEVAESTLRELATTS